MQQHATRSSQPARRDGWALDMQYSYGVLDGKISTALDEQLEVVVVTVPSRVVQRIVVVLRL